MNQKNHVEKLLDLAGGTSAVTAALGVTRQALHKWRRAGRIPAERLIDVLLLADVRWSSALAAAAGAANCPAGRRALTPEAWVALLRHHGGLVKSQQRYIDELFPPGTVAEKTAGAVAALLGDDSFL